MIGFNEHNINRLNLEFKNLLSEKHEKILDYIRDEEASITEKFLNKKAEAYFLILFEDFRHERLLILLLSLTDPDIIKQSKFRDDEIEIIKNLALEKLHRQRILKEHVAMDSLEKQFSN